jgi:hypothetical protein
MFPDWLLRSRLARPSAVGFELELEVIQTLALVVNFLLELLFVEDRIIKYHPAPHKNRETK